MTMATSI